MDVRASAAGLCSLRAFRFVSLIVSARSDAHMTAVFLSFVRFHVDVMNVSPVRRTHTQCYCNVRKM